MGKSELHNKGLKQTHDMLEKLRVRSNKKILKLYSSVIRTRTVEITQTGLRMDQFYIGGIGVM